MKTELLCMATAIFFEARDQPIEGQVLVAEVIKNRVEHTRFPDTVCDVVYQPRAFSFTHDGMSDNMEDYTTYHDSLAREVAMGIARGVLQVEGDTSGEGYSLVGATSTHYHTVDVAPYWSNSFSVDGVIGDHIFYTCSGYC